MEALFMYVPCPSTQIAQTIGTTLLEKHLVGCVNTFPITSCYHWQGSITEEQEVVMLLKTLPELAKKVIDEINALHPYQTPCIAQITVQINESFGAWLKESLVP